MSDSFHRSLENCRCTVQDFYGWPLRFIVGLDQDDVAPIPAAPTTTAIVMEDEAIEAIIGGPFIPLCLRSIPAKGQE